MDILTQIMASPYVSADLQRQFGNPRAARQTAHIERYRAMIAALPPMSAEQSAEIRQDRADAWADECRLEQLRTEREERDSK